MSSKRKTTQTKTPIQDHAPEYRQAVEHHRNGRLEQALDCYEKALRQIPGDARIHHDLGVLYYQTGNNEGAAACFDAAVRYAPEMAEAHFNKGNVLIRLQRPAEAMAAYGRAIRLRPDFADAHFNLANLCKSLDDPRKAEKHYNEALRHHPGHVEAHNNLGNLKLQCGDLDAAIALFNRALDFEPGRTETLYNLALAYKRKGRAGDSVACLKKVLRASPGHSQSKALLVTLLQQLCAWEDLAEAVASLTEDTRDKLARGHLPAESPFFELHPCRRSGKMPAGRQGMVASVGGQLSTATGVNRPTCQKGRSRNHHHRLPFRTVSGRGHGTPHGRTVRLSRPPQGPRHCLLPVPR